MADGERKVGVSEIFSEFGGTLSRHARLSSLAGLGIVAVTSIVDVLLGDSGGQFGGTIASFLIQYHLMEQMLVADGLLSPSVKGRRYLSVVGASILTTLGIMLGFVLFIVPGLLLLARWSLTWPYIIGQGMRATEAMGASWRHTRASMVSITLVYVLCMVLLVMPLAGVGLAEGLASALSGPLITGGVGGTILGNAVAALMAVGGTALTLALYRLLGYSGERLAEVFG
ncbi:glycerophosphoryl diester phosphodiesterase membrane domain-containing protein [Novosphingobium sp. EMRT-2]|uniref:glycerophosphoryl diester phosphodiesterase membrane domain-containing protein n=1 Tax=Novosphingobium sp. EMRT-2 TaxID=2571749 RepID=UPI0010BD2CF1|nr:glycerophosphoryl diester phosphodiesterase membrane domain-containing protein [Novosphingobium sp. EMRT-2]QCI95006.1 hypothetical protein FA702_16775 [Novosphingobium sp. EMRT-2]